jgi:heptaprenyl diphosphate synthase
VTGSKAQQAAEVDSVLKFALTDVDLVAAVKGGLEQVEDVLHGVVRSDNEVVQATALHLVNAGGKRIRPLFTLLAAQFGDPKRQDVITAAAAVELVHIATLYHDDVMDEATLRRGAVSANARWDNTVAILAGDYLFAHASRLVSDLGTDAARIIAETFAELVTGQLRETTGPVHGEDAVKHYLSVIAQKTGSLISTAGLFGGMCSGAAPEHVAALRRYGVTIGAMFQISDDIIDIASVHTESGKNPGTDLREGVRTLPMLYALAESTPEGARLRELLAGPITEDALVDEALDLLRASSALEQARETLADYASAARAELEALPENAARSALNALTEYMVRRTG